MVQKDKGQHENSSFVRLKLELRFSAGWLQKDPAIYSPWVALRAATKICTCTNHEAGT